MMTRLALWMMCCGTLLAASGLSSATVTNRISVADESLLSTMMGGNETCKLTQQTGDCPVVTSGTCSSGTATGTENGCFFIFDDGEDAAFYCQKFGQMAYMPGTHEDHYPECNDVVASGHKDCIDVEFHCYLEWKCDDFCTWVRNWEGDAIATGCTGDANFTAGEGLVPSARRANEFSMVCKAKNKTPDTTGKGE